MNTQPGSNRGRTEDRNHLHDMALRRAHELRQEATDDFWRGANAVLASTAGAAERSARRLALRLSRHGRRYAETVESLSAPAKKD